MHYDWSIIEGYHCPVKIVISRRGLGKTFGKVKTCVEKFVTKGLRFVYIVETGDMVKELARNNGEKFWSALLEYYSKRDTSRKRYFYEKLTDLSVKAVEEGDDDYEKLFERNVEAKLTGGTIIVRGETAGYILDLNSFAEIKRNNFNYVKYVLIDEFISEKMDRTTLQYPKKISSIIQSVCRLRDVKIYMMANAIRFDDPILSRMGFKIKGYGFYYIRDEYGLFAILHFVDPKDYPEFAEAHDRSVAGRFAKLVGETNEEDNKFLSDLPDDRRLRDFGYKKGSSALNIVGGDIILSIRELKNGNYACVPFSNYRTQKLYCLTAKEQGFKMGYMVLYNSYLRDALLNMIRANVIYYYSEVEYAKLKLIIKGGN